MITLLHEDLRHLGLLMDSTDGVPAMMPFNV
ncbi:hypothetical protein AF72_10155 [Xylella taiwanensis]|uniref:Uncharacterized protein n=1 Tax=Xylella taiwanensis TaxID=1444770 RepID=Z9JIE0_9GAMM|nr:hypothetical protein AF72_10155 [Xylella taiwanensis]